MNTVVLDLSQRIQFEFMFSLIYRQLDRDRPILNVCAYMG